MASIEVFPLSVNGIAPPLNLLTQSFTKTINPTNLFYPLDLAANPNYGHAIQIRAIDTKYNISNTVEGLINGTEKLDLSQISQFFNPGGLRAISTKSTLSTISLYMPDSLQMSYSHDWSQVSLTQMLGTGVSTIGASIADWMKVKQGGANANKEEVANLYAKAYSAAAAEFIFGPDAGALVGNIAGTVPNPQLQMLYKGTELREFQFQFKFTPASKREAYEVEKIIETFQYLAAPELLGPVSHQFLKPPQLFEIDFLFVGGTGLSSAVTNFFKNIGTNILTSQLYADLFGGAQQAELNPNNNKARVFQIYHPCALKDISVDYAPNGWAAYEDGAPVETTLSLTFKETDIVTKKDIRSPNHPFGLPVDLNQIFNQSL